MKKTLAILATLSVMAMAGKCYAVGTLWLENYAANKPVYELTAGNLSKSSVYAQILAGPVGGALAPAGALLGPYDLGMDPGFFDYGVADLGSLSGSVELQLVLYKGRPAEATLLGTSAKWTQTLGTFSPTDPPTPMTGPAANIPNSIVLVPEPSTIALGLLGIAALMIRRRK